jgi:ABC-2 type transport system permease protein
VNALTRLALRRDRIMLPIWVYVTVIGVTTSAYELKKLYPTTAARLSLVSSGGSNPALRFLYGRLDGDSLGALTAWRYGVWAALIAALMSVFLVVRHTRGDEDAGRTELVVSCAVNRRAPLIAALRVGVIANVVLAVLLSIILPFLGLPAAGSVLLALGIAACGLVFTGIAAITAQLTSGARAARGIAIGVLGVAFMLRAVGDTGTASWLSWLSPLGWVQLAKPFAGDRWWVLALPVALAVVCVAGSFLLAADRDLGAGLLPDRLGRPAASRWLRDVAALSWRLERGNLAWWAFGYLVLFWVCGAAGVGIGSLLGGSKALRKEFAQLGGQPGIVDAYLSSLMLLAGLIAAGYAIAVVLRLRSAETGGLAEPLLTTAVSRVRWALAQLLVAFAGSVLLLVVAGLFTGLGYGLRGGSLGSGGLGGTVATMAGAGLAEVPAVLVFAGIALLVFGLMPRASIGVAWGALGLVAFLDLFGQTVSLSRWVLDIAPFTHIPHLPGGQVSAAPFLWLLLGFATTSAVGLAALRHRDIG